MDPLIELHYRIMVKALRDPAFRRELLVAPKAALGRELGVTIPDSVEIKVFEDTATTLHLVLPPDPQPATQHELGDDDLDNVTGGWLGFLWKPEPPA